MSVYYDMMNKVSALYSLLEDELSKELFLARIKYDVCQSLSSATQLFALGTELPKEDVEVIMNWKERFEQLKIEGKKIFLYGAGGCGLNYATKIISEGSDFFAFCDTNVEKINNELIGKKIYSPKYLFEHPEECFVQITTMDYYEEVYDYLINQGFPKEHILPYFGRRDTARTLQNKQYFDFMQYYKQNTIFIDGGCYDCAVSLRFADYTKGKYSKIVAFEPVSSFADECVKFAKLKGLERFELIQAGLSNKSTEAVFVTDGRQGSYLEATEQNSRLYEGVVKTNATHEVIRILALDDILQNDHVGFIKLDIEGAEYSALLGAENIIKNHKPLLAISVYHLVGDIVAIMDYLHNLVPEYHFWVRNYAPLGMETVLYAAITD